MLGTPPFQSKISRFSLKQSDPIGFNRLIYHILQSKPCKLLLRPSIKGMTVTLDTLLPKEEGLVVRFQLSQLAQLSIGAMGFKTERLKRFKGG